MSTKHIPQDIVDCVIFFLHGDQKTLFDTSIVSKAWINPSRRYLFHKIKVERPRGVFPFDFLAFVETKPHIATYIKQLRIQGDVDNDAFPQLLAALPSLSVLSIRDWSSPMREIAGPVERKYTLEYLLLDVMSSHHKYFGHEDVETTTADITDGHKENEQGQDGDDDDGDDDDDEEEEEEEEEDVEDVDELEETMAGSIHSDGSEISEAGGTQWDPSRVDATRLSNFLSLFSSVQELDLRTQPFYYHDWTLTNSQLAEILPDHRRGTLAVKAFKSSHRPSQSYFEFFNRILDLGILEELVIKYNNFPTCTALGTLIRESTSLRKISLALGEYLGEDVFTMGLGNCLSLRHLFLEPEACTMIPRRGQKPEVVFEWSGAQEILGTDLQHLHQLSIQIRRAEDVANPIIGCLESVDWEWLDERIIVGMPNLECVEFLCEAENPKKRTVDSDVQERKSLEEYIFERLPRARRKALVRVGNAVEFLKIKNRGINNYYVYALQDSRSEGSELEDSELENSSVREEEDV